MTNVITKLKGIECNEMNLSIEEESTNMNKEEDVCNTENSKLKDTQIENNFEENIGEINIHEKDEAKEDSRKDKEVNVAENKNIPIKENRDIAGIGELLEKNLDGVEEINCKCSDEHVDSVNLILTR